MSLCLPNSSPALHTHLSLICLPSVTQSVTSPVNSPRFFFFCKLWLSCAETRLHPVNASRAESSSVTSSFGRFQIFFLFPLLSNELHLSVHPSVWHPSVSRPSETLHDWNHQSGLLEEPMVMRRGRRALPQVLWVTTPAGDGLRHLASGFAVKLKFVPLACSSTRLLATSSCFHTHTHTHEIHTSAPGRWTWCCSVSKPNPELTQLRCLASLWTNESKIVLFQSSLFLQSTER